MRPRALLALAALTPVTLIGIPAQWLALKAAPRLSRRIPLLFHRYVNRIMGIRRTVVGAPAPGRPLLIAANHASWLDITVLAAILPVSFVAKREVGTWPVIGTFARLQRSVFVDRARRSATGRTTAEMAGRLRAGDALVLFAEGTSNDGNRVYPFRSALLGAARDAMTDADAGIMQIQPVALAYTRIHGLPVGRYGRARLAWYGDMDLGPHLVEVLGMGAIDVTVVFGTPVAYMPGGDRKALAAELERSVRRAAAAARMERGHDEETSSPPAILMAGKSV